MSWNKNLGSWQKNMHAIRAPAVEYWEEINNQNAAPANSCCWPPQCSAVRLFVLVGPDLFARE
jgi:hypothetical protein